MYIKLPESVSYEQASNNLRKLFESFKDIEVDVCSLFNTGARITPPVQAGDILRVGSLEILVISTRKREGINYFTLGPNNAPAKRAGKLDKIKAKK